MKFLLLKIRFFSHIGLTLNRKIASDNNLYEVRDLLKALWEEKKLLVIAITPMLTMFSTLSKTNFFI